MNTILTEFEILKEMYGIGVWEFVLRIGIASIVGILFGIERKQKGKPAGIKTNMLACVGATVVALIQVMIYNNTNFNNSLVGDPTRLTAQVISGLGFLGAGVIMTGKDKVVGLTTAATLWVVAVLGIGIGYGFYHYIVIASVIILILSHTIKKVEFNYIDKRKVRKLILEYVYNSGVEEAIEELLEEKDVKIITEKRISEVNDGDYIIIKKIIHFSLPTYASYKVFRGVISKYEGVINVTKIK